MNRLAWSPELRRGAILLGTLIGAIVLIGLLYPLLRPTPRLLFYSTLDSIDRPLCPMRYENAKESSRTIQTPLRLVPFDPNRVDSVELARMGLPRTVQRSLLNYRRTGGRLRTPASVERLYGISPDLFAQIRPFLLFPDSTTTATAPAHEKKRKEAPPFGSIDLNRADTTLLQQIPSIGPHYARLIVSYRRALAGYLSVDQLHEIDRIPDSVRQKVYPYLTCHPDSIRPLSVNQTSIERLNAHPYLTFPQARAIDRYRRKRGRIKNLLELRLLDEFSEAEWQRIAPYLTVE